MKNLFLEALMFVALLVMFSTAYGEVNDYGFDAFKQTVEQEKPEKTNNGQGLTNEQVLALVNEYVQQHEFSTKQDITELRVTNEFWYIVLLCGVALISLLLVLYFLKDHRNCPRDIVNAAGLILIIFGTIILVLVVDTTEQLTAAIGVLGAIAGYLFGTIQSERRMSGTSRQDMEGQ